MDLKIYLHWRLIKLWASLKNHSYYSLLHSSTKPIKLAERAAQLGLSSIALTDEGSITGVVAFMKALKNTCLCGHHKNSHGDSVCYGNNKRCKCTVNAQAKDFPTAAIKPILGSEVKIAVPNGSVANLVLLAKNYLGWKRLISLTSEANREENIIKGSPTLTFDKLSKFCDGNIIGISGSASSELANCLFNEPERLYFAGNYADGRKFSNNENFQKTLSLAGKYQDVFGKENFFLNVELINQEGFPGCAVLTSAMRKVSEKTGIPCVATADSFYPYPEDSDDQRLLTCSYLGATYDSVDSKLVQPENAYLRPFFQSNKYYVASPQEIEALHTKEEVQNSLLIAEQCESYNILSKPILPVFDCPDGKSPDQYLKELCARGWKQKITPYISPADLDKYKRQIREELAVIQGAGLSSYFLIVEDYCRAATEMGQLLGNGRGSAAGSLIAYLTHITKVDPVLWGLMFTRFYNDGRNTADRVSLPDIDSDMENRDEVIEYVMNKYGRDKVAQMITFSRIQGRGALKEVFRVKFPDISMDIINKITAEIPDESEIIDKLQDMKEAGEEPSIITWALEGNTKNLKPYCYIDDQGELQGEYAPVFRVAIRLEGTKKSQGKHPSGIVIAHTSLSDIAPMIYDKNSKKSVCGFEMYELEEIGVCKFDILQTDVLKKLHNVSKLLAGQYTDD